MFNMINQTLKPTVKKRLSYFVLTLFSQLYPYNMESCAGMEGGDRSSSGWDSSLMSSENLLLLPENPNLDSLNHIEKRKLALFVENDKLYCKISGQDQMEIPVDKDSNHTTKKGLSQKVFEEIKSVLTDKITNPKAFQFALSMEEQHAPVATVHYKDVYGSIENDELSAVLDFISLSGYLPNKSSILNLTTSNSPNGLRQFGAAGFGELNPKRLMKDHTPSSRLSKRPRIEDSHDVLKLSIGIWSSILQHIQNPATDLRLVCKNLNIAYVQNRLFAWKFDPKNYPLFPQEKGKIWVEEALGMVSRLSFFNNIDLSRVNDEISEDEWKDENVFLSQEDFKYINEKAIKLEELIIYNISCMDRYLNFQAPYASSLVSFQFDYDGKVFREIPADYFIGCAQFSNLKNINIPSDIFSCRGKVTDGFSSLTNLEKLTLQNVWRDEPWSACATDLFGSLTDLKKLNTLVVHGIPNLPALNNLSLLTSLTGLELHFTDPVVVNQDDFPTLINSLPNLKSIAINCDGYTLNYSEIFFIHTDSLALLYPQLEEIKGNMICKSQDLI